MNNRNLVRGLFLVAISLLFGIWSLKYQIGQFSRAGPGLFPLMVSCILFLIGVVTLIRARFVEPESLHFNFKNLAIVLLSLGGFAVISEYVNMIAGIVFMVFVSTYAGTSYSLVRNLKLSAGLIAIAFAMSKLLGVNLPLF
ncbi:MAG: tripartite tricarboxylate transporter TctB family protein [Caldimonas sp.]